MCLIVKVLECCGEGYDGYSNWMKVRWNWWGWSSSSMNYYLY